MKLAFPPKRNQIKRAILGAGFGLGVVLLLFLANWFFDGASIMRDFSIFQIFIGIISFVWVVSYLTVGLILQLMIGAGSATNPSFIVIAISPIIFYSLAFWFFGSVMWAIKDRKNKLQKL